MNRSMRWIAIGLALTARLSAQERVTLRVQVNSVAGRSVFVDAGRAQGVRPGLDLELDLPGLPPLTLTIRDVAANSARAEVPLGFELPSIGTPGRIDVDVTRDTERSVEPRRAQAPAHPPWTAGVDPGVAPDTPLLAPAFGRTPAERPTRWSGRVFSQLLMTHDRTGGADDSFRGRLGTRLDVENPFGHGGRLEFDAELTRRSLESPFDGERTDDRGRLDQLSYTIGDDELANWRIQVGRFVSLSVPQLGMLDGVEAVRRIDREWSLGFGIGLTPLPFRDRMTGDDLGMHAFLQWRGRERAASFTAGLQKTWHLGSADRDLFFTRFDWSPTGAFRLDGALKVDFFDGSDSLESGSMEVSEAWLAVSTRPFETINVGLDASTWRWPQLRRADFAFLPNDLIRDGHVERLSPRVSIDIGRELRLSARASHWRDQTRSGTSFDLGADIRDVVGTGFDLFLGGWSSEGSFQSGPGVRARLSRRIGSAALGIRGDWARFESNDLIGGESTIEQVRAGFDLDVPLGDRLNLSLDGELISGDRQDGWFAGFFIQYRL